MRKITFFLTALLLSVVASAQVATGVYTIGVDANQQRGYIGYGYTVANETETVYENFPVLTGITWNSYTGNSSTAKDNGKNWYIVSNPAGTGYYLYNVVKGKFIEPGNDNKAYYTDTPYLWQISQQTGEYSAYYNIINPKATGANKYLSGACGTTPADGNVKIGNNATDGGSLMTLTAVDGGTTTFATQISAANQAILNAVLVPARSMAQNSTGTRVGAYLATDVADLKTALSNYDSEQSNANLAAVETAYNHVITNGTKVTLSANEKFVLKCKDTNRGYLVYSTVPDKGSETRPYLASTNNNTHPTLTDNGVYKEWAYVEKDGKKLIFNVQKKQFINTDYIVKFSDLGYAFNFVEMATEDYLWNIKVDGSNKYLSFSPGWSSGEIVRLEGSVDDGCKFYIDKVDGKITEALITDALKEEMLAINWKGAERPILGYVGGYPSDAASALDAVNSSSAITNFENSHNRIPMAEGYYFLRSATNQNKKDAYLSYNGTDCYVFTLGAGEKLSAKHVWYLKSPQDGGYKLMACNLQKYLKTANAAGTPTVSPITSDFENGFKYVLSSGDISGSWILKDGNNHVLRTEDDGRVNYWTSNTNATWYIIPATELDVNIGATGYATTYLPFDVNLPNDLAAYAVTETSGSEATLAAKNSIPAGQGALLKGAKNTGYKLTISKNAVASWGVNKLTGTYTTQNIVPAANTTCYVLAANGSNGAGFYKATLNQGNTDAFQNNANKAYLPVSTAGARFLTFDFDDNAETGISAVEIEEAAPANAAIYDLSGRRVQSAKSGLYIINGKKVIK